MGLTAQERVSPQPDNAEGWTSHPFIRNNWGIRDRLRGATGYYYTEQQSQYGDIPQMRHLHNEVSQLKPLIMSVEGGFNDQDDERIVIKFDNAGWNQAGDSAGAGQDTGDLLDQFKVDDEDYEGNPYFDKYLTKGFFSHDPLLRNGTTQVLPIFNEIGSRDYYFDYNTSYKKPPDDQLALQDSSYVIKVNPVYNHYLHTSPRYETVIKNVPEMMIPNAYVFEAELRNPNPTPLDNKYINIITLNGFADEWFGGFANALEAIQIPGGDGRGYFDHVAKGLGQIGSDPAALEAQTAQYNSMFKNYAVLEGDLGALDKFQTRQIGLMPGAPGGSPDSTTVSTSDALATDFYPFYNEVIIGADPFPGSAAGGSLLQKIYNSSEVVDSFQWGDSPGTGKDYINLLQIFAVNVLSNAYEPLNRSLTDRTGSGPLSFEEWTQDLTYEAIPGRNFPESSMPTLNYTVNSETIDILFSLEDFASEAFMGDGGQGFIDPIAQSDNPLDEYVIQAGSYEKNYTFIKDYTGRPAGPITPANPPGMQEVNPITRLAPSRTPGMDLYELHEIADTVIDDHLRSIHSVLGMTTNRPSGMGGYQSGFAPTDVLMYVVEKRLASADVTSPPLQTIFLSRIFSDPQKDLKYIDNQIKYGVAYQYNIKQVRIIFGNLYGYRDPQIFYSKHRGLGRAIGNALGFFRPENPGLHMDDYFVEQYPPRGGYLAEDPEMAGSPLYTQEHHGNDPFDPNDDTVEQTWVGPTLGGATDSDIAHSHTGKFIYQPANWAAGVDVEAAPGWVANYASDYVAAGPLAHNSPEGADQNVFQNFSLEVKTGMGFDGNNDGGALSGDYRPMYNTLDLPPPPEVYEESEEATELVQEGNEFRARGGNTQYVQEVIDEYERYQEISEVIEGYVGVEADNFAEETINQYGRGYGGPIPGVDLSDTLAQVEAFGTTVDDPSLGIIDPTLIAQQGFLAQQFGGQEEPTQPVDPSQVNDIIDDSLSSARGNGFSLDRTTLAASIVQNINQSSTPREPQQNVGPGNTSNEMAGQGNVQVQSQVNLGLNNLLLQGFNFNEPRGN
jgi:hypothetical protein